METNVYTITEAWKANWYCILIFYGIMVFEFVGISYITSELYLLSIIRHIAL